MTYFENFPFVQYRFGDANVQTPHPNLSIYADIFDSFKNNNSYYEKYTIMDGDRPDTLSQRFYNNTKYAMTFYLMNDKIREQGFPLSSRELDVLIKRERKYDVVTLNEGIAKPTLDAFNNDEFLNDWEFQMTGRRIAKVIRKDYDLRQLVFESSGEVPFSSAENLFNPNTKALLESNDYTITKEYESIWRYRDENGNYIDPYSITETSAIVTYYDKYVEENNALKDIIVIKPNIVSSIYEQFQNAIRG